MDFSGLHFTGLLLGMATFLIIGIFHPVVVKFYYWFGTRCWWWFLVLGLAAVVASLFVEAIIWQTLLGVLAFSSFWTTKEIFEQRERVAKGWFPANPKRRGLGCRCRGSRVRLSSRRRADASCCGPPGRRKSPCRKET